MTESLAVGERLFGTASFVQRTGRRGTRYVVTSRARSSAPSISTRRLESPKTKRFSPRCSAAMTFAALATEPT